MADDKLRIVATVEDQFTGPLGKLEKGLKGVGDQGAKQASTWRKDWSGVREEASKFQGVLKGFDPIFSAVGVTGFGAAMSITGMVSALRGFAGSTQQLSMLSHETGVAVDKLRAFGDLGERFGVSTDAMKGSVASFATTMFDLRQRWGEAYTSLQAMNLGKLAEDLVNAPNMDEALKRAVDGIQAIPEPEVRRRVSRMLFGTDDIARIAGSMTGKFSEALAQVQKEVGHLDKATEEAAARFEQSMGRIGAAAERLKLKVLGPILKGTADLIEDAEKNGLAGNDGEQAIRNQLSPFGGAEATPREKLEGRRAQVESQLKLLEAGPRGADYQRKHDRMVEELKRVADELQKVRENGGASVSPSSFGGPAGGGSLIQKAAWGGGAFGGAGVFGGSVGGGSGVQGSGGGGSGGGSDGGARDVPDAPEIGGGMRGRPFGSKSSFNGDRSVDTPRGSGAGTRGAARTGDMMRYAMDQLRREGVPEAHLREAAAHLVGQAHMESGLNPNTVHDGGTGYGIYGARDPRPGRGRKTSMLNWLKANGYAPNSAEGQMRYMVHEAMSGRYPRTKGILMGRGSGDLGRDTDTITGEFESPRIINRRSGAVRNALRNGPDREAEGGPAIPPRAPDAKGSAAVPPAPRSSDDPDFFPNGAPRVMKPKSMADDPRVPGVVMDHGRPVRPDDGGFRQERPWTKAPGVDGRADLDAYRAERERRARAGDVPTEEENEATALAKWRPGQPTATPEVGRRPEILADPKDERRTTARAKVGEALMDRMYGRGASGHHGSGSANGTASSGQGTLRIQVEHGFPERTKVRPAIAGLFRETSVSHGRAQMDMTEV